MKTLKLLFLSIGAGIIFTACSHHHHSHSSKPLPPGQAKKITGSKSAKPYAPGQQKKH
ncbi:MAG: quinol oxidase subunit 4 [Sphingobacteriales bacterium]|nr:quinol oxidase subunit 4 [Sphingobacteriales bacterium]